MTKSLRIIHTEAAAGFGGQEHRILKEMIAMRERGHYLEAICTPQSLLFWRLQAAGFIAHSVDMRSKRKVMLAMWQILKILQQGRFDVLNTHSRADTVRAAVAGRIARIPLIVRTRHMARRPRSLFTYTTLPHRVIAVSDHVRKQLLDNGVPETHVKTVLDAVELPKAGITSTLHRELDLPQGSIVIGSVGHLREMKGHETLVEAAAPLLKARPLVHIVIVGEGQSLRQKLEERIATLRLWDRIHLLGRRDDIDNLLHGFDVFALATRREALGTAYIEASACGIPVVGTRVGGVPEVIEDGRTGILVPPNDPERLRLALLRLIDDPQLRLAYGRAGFLAIRESRKFTMPFMAEATEAAYRHWLNK